VQRELVLTLARRLEIAQIEEERQKSGKLQILDKAEPPRRKSGPSGVKSALATFILLTMLLGMAWGGWRGWLTLHDESEGDDT
jgi:uncharacterized protein involved in exopolysaccharide biosynthesis